MHGKAVRKAAEGEVGLTSRGGTVLQLGPPGQVQRQVEHLLTATASAGNVMYTLLGFRVVSSRPPELLLPKRTEFRFPPNHPFGEKVGLCQVRGKYWVAKIQSPEPRVASCARISPLASLPHARSNGVSERQHVHVVVHQNSMCHLDLRCPLASRLSNIASRHSPLCSQRPTLRAFDRL